MLENRNEDVTGLYSLDEPKLLGEDTAGTFHMRRAK